MDYIPIPNALDQRIKERIHQIEQKPISRKRVTVNRMAIAASITLISACLFIQPQVRAFASEIPIVKQVLDFIWKEPALEMAKSNNYPVYDFHETNEEGYTLYVQDVYMDPCRITMKICLKSPEGKLMNLSQSTVGLKIGNGTHTTQTGFYESEPWVYLNLVLLDKHMPYISEEQSMTYSISLYGKDYTYKSKEYSYELPTDYQYKSYDLNQVVTELEGGELKVKTLHTYAGNTILDYDLISHDNRARLRLDSIELQDEEGVIYESSYSQSYYSKAYNSLFTPFNKKVPDLLYVNLTYSLDPDIKKISIPVKEEQSISFTYREREFKITSLKEESQGSYVMTVFTDERIDISQWPALDYSAKEIERLEGGQIRGIKKEWLALESKRLERDLQRTINELLKLEDKEADILVRSYLLSQYDIDLSNDESDIKSILEFLQDNGVYYINDRMVKQNKLTLSFTSLPKGRKELDFVLHGNKETKDLQIPIEIH